MALPNFPVFAFYFLRIFCFRFFWIWPSPRPLQSFFVWEAFGKALALPVICIPLILQWSQFNQFCPKLGYMCDCIVNQIATKNTN